MNKRGQVYLLVAIILCFVIYLLIVERNISVEKVIEDDFKELSSNYEVEGSKFVNSLMLANEKDVSDSFINFSILYSSYARAQNPYFGLIYAFYDNNILHLGNYMDQPIMVDYKQGAIGLNGCYNDLSATIDFAGFSISPGLKNIVLQKSCIANVSSNNLNEISIILNGGYYTFGIMPNKPEIIIVSRESLEGVSKVYVGGEFKKAISGPKEKDLCAQKTNKEDCEKLGCIWKGSSCILPCNYYGDKDECIKDVNCCWDLPNRLGAGLYGITFQGTYCKDKGNCLTKCSDGTNIEQCSSTKPKYCTLEQGSLKLLNNCRICGCNSGYTCQTSSGDCIEGVQCQNCKTSSCSYYDDCVTGTGTCSSGYCCSGSCTTIQPTYTCAQLGGSCKSGYCSTYNSCSLVSGATDCGYGYQCCSGICISQPICTPSWSCTTWSSCVNNVQTRTCTDNNRCGIACNNNLICGTTQSCTPTCTPNWQCSTWSACINGQQTRTCNDVNNCGTTVNKPVTTQTCVVTKKFNCRSEYRTGSGTCDGGKPACDSGYENLGCGSDCCDCCHWYNTCSEKTIYYNCKCQKDYWTDCSGNPSCGSDTKLGEQTC